MVRRLPILIAGTLFFAFSATAVPVELGGSPESMERQNRIAVQSGLPFAKSFEDIEHMLDRGELVRLPGNEFYELRRGVSSDALRPEARLFVERLAEDYFRATGEKLVVTSLTRPMSNQPRNSHALSVHPTGMAIDLRISQRPASQRWIERHLLGKEAAGLLDITRERFPPHYHVALFPGAYMKHLEHEMGPEEVASAIAAFDKVDYGAFHEEDAVVIEEAEDVIEPRRMSIWGFILSLFGRG